MTVFSITDIPEFSKKERIVVVGIIGKSPLRYPNKTTPLLPSVQSNENGIECHWDERRSLLYLHAVTYFDTKRLVELASDLSEDSKSRQKDADAAHWLVASGELAEESCRLISLVFQLSHIVVLSSPTSTFDLGYLQIFKAIDAYRSELTPSISAALANISSSINWETHNRSCCPRLLFHFRRAPTPLKRNLAALKRLEHAVEDQLYFILRKTRIITNVCAKSLFAIPKNEEFVYISADNDSGNARDLSSLVRGLVHMCEGTEPEQPVSRPSFKTFLQAHVDKAFGDGFDDNVGKYAMSTSFFELPSASTWRRVARALVPLFLAEPSPQPDGDDAEPPGALYAALATDVRFSAARCAKVLPIAQASYAEGLPSHYSSQHHAHKVSVALGVVCAQGRGPLGAGAARRLRAACGAAWAERTLCEAPSLTGHPCVHPDHAGSAEHSSGVRFVSACDCGRTRAPRDDPYSAREANHDFYVAAAALCPACPTLHRHHFPVFEPSTPTYRAASVRGCSSQEEGSGGSSTSDSWPEGEDLSPPEHEHEREPDDEPEHEHRYVLHPSSNTEKSISRQPSTTEYLPGMLHLASPLGLLPAWASWALVCLGPSSLYSHSLGLPDHLHPGFLPHTNYLLPWDCAVRMEHVSTWRLAQARGRGKSTTPHQLTVKIFIGFEYECPRGHRFMMCSGGTAVSGCAGAGAGALAATRDMPAAGACACRAPAPLTRLHVVTPKAPVHVTLDPRVQPVAGGPIFVPAPAGSPPVKLSASAYWVLRLPYVYCDERGVLPRPTAHHPGHILAPIFGLEE